MSEENKIVCCGTCLWYNGESGDGTQFCDDKEVYVSENGWCARYRAKELLDETEIDK